MDKFMFSNKPQGPWMELREYGSAQEALSAAQASFNWQTVWVAKMREAGPDDIFPADFIDGLNEDLVLKHGNGLAEDIMRRLYRNRDGFMEAVWAAGDKALASDEGPIWIADMTHQYGPLQSVRPADFNRELQAQISQEETRKAIEAQRARKHQEEKELEAWKKAQETKKPKLDELL